MPSVTEAEPAEFAETAATLVPRMERIFFAGGSGVGGRRIRACGPIGLSGTRARVPPATAVERSPVGFSSLGPLCGPYGRLLYLAMTGD
jgi:hypothetical protein